MDLHHIRISPRRTKPILAAALGAFILNGMAGETQAGTFQFVPPGPQVSFETGTNWNPFGPPGAFDTALFNAIGAYEALFNSSPTNNILDVADGDVTFRPALSFQGVQHIYTLAETSFIDGGSLTLMGNGNESFRLELAGFEPRLQVGNTTNGALTILDGGAAQIQDDVNIGRLAGSTGAVTVDGPSASLNLGGSGFLRVGDDGNGTLTIRNGGTVVSPTARIGNDPGSSGDAIVEGAGSSWSTNSLLVGAFGGDGTLLIQNGGSVSSTSSDIAFDELSTGEVTVSGADSSWSIVNDLEVGDQGDGTLLIENGASVTSRDGILAEEDVSTGQATVVGSGSRWTMSEDLRVGDEGSGTLNIVTGATVSSLTSSVGHDVGSEGIVLITGEGASWSTAETLVVGGSAQFGPGGAGIINIFTGTTVQAGSVVVHPQGQIGLLGGELSAGSIEVLGGRLIATGSTGTILDAFVMNSGVIEGPSSLSPPLQFTGNVAGDGAYEGNMLFSAGFDPGPGVDQINFGIVEFDDTSELSIDIQGAAHDVITSVITTIGGTLDISTCCGFSAVVGDQFEIITATSGIEGEFDSIETSTLPDGMSFDVIYGSNNVIIEVIDPSMPNCPADLDDSGEIGFNDLLVLLAAWGSDDAAADLDDDGVVGFSDLLMLLTAWGACA